MVRLLAGICDVRFCKVRAYAGTVQLCLTPKLKARLLNYGIALSGKRTGNVIEGEVTYMHKGKVGQYKVMHNWSQDFYDSICHFHVETKSNVEP